MTSALLGQEKTVAKGVAGPIPVPTYYAGRAIAWHAPATWLGLGALPIKDRGRLGHGNPLRIGQSVKPIIKGLGMDDE